MGFTQLLRLYQGKTFFTYIQRCLKLPGKAKNMKITCWILGRGGFKPYSAHGGFVVWARQARALGDAA